MGRGSPHPQGWHLLARNPSDLEEGAWEWWRAPRTSQVQKNTRTEENTMGWYKVPGEGPGPCSNPKCCNSGYFCTPLSPQQITYINHHPYDTGHQACSSTCLGPFDVTYRCPQPQQPGGQTTIRAAGKRGGTTYSKLLYADGMNADLTTVGCLSIPLTSGGVLNFSWNRFSGLLPAQVALQDTWMPAGSGAVFTFFPIVNTYAASYRRRTSAKGTVNYARTNTPDAVRPYGVTQTTTYWTEYDQVDRTYFEYFAGSSLATTDPMFGRLNRMYSVSGSTLWYSYSPNAGGQQLLRKIAGLTGNLIPYFSYANETIDATHFAPITSILIADLTDATKNQPVYFEYVSNIGFNYPFLTKIVYPSGCVRLFQALSDSNGSYRVAAEVDPEGYTTYFVYVNNLLATTLESTG